MSKTATTSTAVTLEDVELPVLDGDTERVKTVDPLIGTKHTRNSLRKQFADFINAVDSIVLGRRQEIILIMSGLLAEANVLLYSTPGEGKSMLARTIYGNIVGAECFQAQLTATMDPDEILGGMISEHALLGNTVRRTKKRLPEADVAVLDELGKCPDALTTDLMRLLNEREFRNGDDIMQSPLTSIIACTNECDHDVQGLYERFAVKLLVRKPSDDITMELINRRILKQQMLIAEEVKLQYSHFPYAKVSVSSQDFPIEIRALVLQYANFVNQQIHVDTRKILNAIPVIQASSWIQGISKKVTIEDLAILPYLLSNTPDEIETLKQSWKSFRSSLTMPAPGKPTY